MGEVNNYEQCWNTGIYDGYDCEMCPYKNECSGYEDEED